MVMCNMCIKKTNIHYETNISMFRNIFLQHLFQKFFSHLSQIHYVKSVYHAPFKFDRNGNGGGLLLYVREDIPAKVLYSDFPAAESFYAEIILHKKRWLINCSYNPHKNNICRHLEVVTKTLDSYYSKYENVIFLGDFNAGVLETPMTSFCESYNLIVL